MCTIVMLHGAHPAHPLVVAANRDEFYAREATAPRPLSQEPRAAGGVDCTAGGTWMGASEDGFFVGITNQRTWFPPDRSLRSRGALALEVLRCGTAEAARRHLAELDPSTLNSFNLVFGEPGALYVAYGRTEDRTVELHELGEGIHVLANDRIGSPEFPKAQRAERLVRDGLELPWEEMRQQLEQMLADHQMPPAEGLPQPPEGSPLTPDFVRRLQAICIHTPTYGTRSATLLALGEGQVSEYWFADGAPCETPFDDYTALVARRA